MIPNPPLIKKLRLNIDRTDQQIPKLLKQRKDLALKIAQFKIQSNQNLRQPQREKIVLSHVKKLSKELDLNPGFTKHLFQLIINNSLHEQKKHIKNYPPLISIIILLIISITLKNELPIAGGNYHESLINHR